jgi:TATA-box binding protein (TBP) (component of TFIID and TFIIIB)
MKPFESLDQTFDVAASELIKAKKEAKPIKVSDKSEDKEKDYDYARGQLYNIVERMQEALEGAMEVAQQSDHPRAYEVCFNGAKSAAEVVEKIGDLHKKMADLNTEETKVTQNNVQNNVFMNGTTADLMKMLKNAND